MKTIMNSRKIYIITHKDNSQIPKAFDKNLYELLNVHNLYPFYNRLFSEYSGMYYIWKNKIYSDYVGFCHYHRYIFEHNLLDDLNNDEYQYFFTCGKSKYILLDYLPKIISNDFYEFLNMNDVKYKTNNITFYSRCIYYCNWYSFNKLMIFLNSYINFIKNKYNIKNEEDWRNHVINNIISYYKDIEYSKWGHKTLYQEKIEYMNMFNDDYGFNSPICNQWRVYSYLIEFLISIYINNHIPRQK